MKDSELIRRVSDRMTNFFMAIYQIKVSFNTALFLEVVKAAFNNRRSVTGTFMRGSEINYCVFFHVYSSIN